MVVDEDAVNEEEVVENLEIESEPFKLEDKHYYVMARSAGIVFNILGSDNYNY